MTRLRSLLVAGIAAVLAVSCGSDAGDAASDTTTPSASASPTESTDSGSAPASESASATESEAPEDADTTGAATDDAATSDTVTSDTEGDATDDDAANDATSDDAASDDEPVDGGATSGDADTDGDADAEAGDTSDEPTTRMVEHFFGTTEVPASPQRLAVLNAGTILPTLLELGLGDIIVAAPLPEAELLGQTSLIDPASIEGIESVGFPETNFELLALVDPDMIITFGGADVADAYEQMSAIAPTVAVPIDFNDWKRTAVDLGDAIGRSDEMAEALSRYETRVEELRSSLGDAVDTEVSIVRAVGPNIRLHTRFHFAGQVIEDVGLPRPASQQTDDPDVRFVQVSLEEMELADADVMYVFGAGSVGSVGDEVDASVQMILDHPLYPTLSVAENDTLFVVDPLAWQQGGLPAANFILDDLERTLLGG